MMSPAESTSTQSKIDITSQNLDESIALIIKDAEAKEKLAARQHRWDMVFRATTAILAVASPALVTYATTPGVPDIYKLAAILLSGIAGAAATLQVIFALQQNYVRNAIDALDLYELKAQMESEKATALKMGADDDRLSDLRLVLDKTTRRHREIIIGKQRSYLEKEEQSGLR